MTTNTNKKLLLIDTFNFLHRAYHALPKTFKDANGEPVNAVYGVTSMIINVLDQIRPNYIAAALDGMRPTFRVENFTGYKAHRKPMDTELSSQIPKVFEILDAFGIKKLQVDGYEADDIIATIATRFHSKADVIIVSNDRDLWQLAHDNIMLMVPSTKGDTSWMGYKEAEARLGFDPTLIAEYKGLRGDPSDNLPGVFGVGEVTATKLIQTYQTLDNLYRNIQSIEPLSLREKLLNCYEQALMSRNLAKLILDVPVDVTIEDCVYTDFNKYDVKKVLERYNFKSLIKRLGFETSPKAKKELLSEKDDALGLGLF